MTDVSFLHDEGGAITIDWVVLAAGVMIVSAGFVGFLTEELQPLVDRVEEEVLRADKLPVPSEN